MLTTSTIRRKRPTAICHSGGKRTIFDCVCGARHTTSTDWNGRYAKHVLRWRAYHDEHCRDIYEAIRTGKTTE